MSLPRYPEYKDSGVAWLGKVPAHWRPAKVRTFTRFCGGGTPSRENLSYWNGDIPWVSPKDMKAERIAGAEECITETGLAASTTSMIDQGSLLLVVRSGILKHTIPVAINDVPVALNQDMKAFRFVEGSATSGFFLRWVQGLNNLLLLAWAKQGATVESIEHTYLAGTVVPLPPPEEQTAITTFLNRETAKIDALIAEQEKLLALLAEKRQATISHVVTRGLDHNVPMKDSGISWLGEVPAHWDVVPLMHLVDPKRPVMYGIVLPGPSVEGGVPIVKGGDVKAHRLCLNLLNRTTAEIEAPYARARLAPNDLVYSIRGTIGDAEIVSEELKDANITQDVARIAPAAGIQSMWLLYAMRSKPVFVQLEQRSLGAAVRGINIYELDRARIPVPPQEEREAIASFLSDALSRLGAMASQSENAIALLRERRSALIAAAVTGQIDVRAAAALASPHQQQEHAPCPSFA
jgi:type I restriction enzyme S subunit